MNQLINCKLQLTFPIFPSILLLRLQHLPLLIDYLLRIHDIHEVVLVVFLDGLLFRRTWTTLNFKNILKHLLMNEARWVWARTSLFDHFIRVVCELAAETINILFCLVSIEAEVEHLEKGLEKLTCISFLIQVKSFRILSSIIKLE